MAEVENASVNGNKRQRTKYASDDCVVESKTESAPLSKIDQPLPQSTIASQQKPFAYVELSLITLLDEDEINSMPLTDTDKLQRLNNIAHIAIGCVFVDMEENAISVEYAKLVGKHLISHLYESCKDDCDCYNRWSTSDMNLNLMRSIVRLEKRKEEHRLRCATYGK